MAQSARAGSIFYKWLYNLPVTLEDYLWLREQAFAVKEGHLQDAPFALLCEILDKEIQQMADDARRYYKVPDAKALLTG